MKRLFLLLFFFPLMASCMDNATYYNCFTEGEERPLAFYFTPKEDPMAFVGVNEKKFSDASAVSKIDYTAQFPGLQKIVRREGDKIFAAYVQQTVKGFYLDKGVLTKKDKPIWDKEGELDWQEEIHMTFFKVYEHGFDLKTKSMVLTYYASREDTSFEVTRQKHFWNAKVDPPQKVRTDKQALSKSLENEAKEALLALYPKKVLNFSCQKMTEAEIAQFKSNYLKHLFRFP